MLAASWGQGDLMGGSVDLVLAMELEERLVVGFRWHLPIDCGS